MNRFGFTLADGNAALCLDGRPLFDGLRLAAAFTRSNTFVAEPAAIEETDGEVRLVFLGEKHLPELWLTLRCDASGATARLSLHAKTGTWQWMERYKFAPDRSLSLLYRDAVTPDGILTNSMHRSVYWSEAEHDRSPSDLAPVTQSVLRRHGDRHVHLLPLYNDGFRTEFSGDRILCSTGGYGFREMDGNVLAMSVASDPYTAISQNFSAACKSGAVGVRPVSERPFPYVLDGFGWCTWDAFYKEVTEEKIFKKLDEFREKGIRLRWMLIDDGWSCFVDNCRLYDTVADTKKFPSGLGRVIRRIKDEYGVSYVGVWHAFTGYWEGFDEGSPVFLREKDNLVRTAEGYWFLKPEYDAVFGFFDRWHAYLAAEGVDFIKVDNQGSYSSKIECLYPATKANRIYHEALDASAKKHFHGQLLNCMGESTEDLFHSPEAPITRSSDDYFPKHEGSFAHHVQQNVYNALIQSEIRHCDFDMWWSRHESALPSAVLRAISGGPIYVSDELFATDPTYIAPLTDGEGGIYRPDRAALPTADCIYLDVRKAKKPLKVFNRKDDAFAVAAFTVCGERVTGELRLSDIPDASGDYLAENYFTGEKTLMTPETAIPFSVGENEAALFNLYPVKNGEVNLGMRDKFIGIATPRTRRAKV